MTETPCSAGQRCLHTWDMRYCAGHFIYVPRGKESGRYAALAPQQQRQEPREQSLLWAAR